MSKWAKYVKKYCAEWEMEEPLREWLRAVQGDERKAACLYCRSEIRAHHTDLIKHMGTEKHRRNAARFAAQVGSAAGPDVQAAKKTSESGLRADSLALHLASFRATIDAAVCEFARAVSSSLADLQIKISVDENLSTRLESQGDTLIYSEGSREDCRRNSIPLENCLWNQHGSWMSQQTRRQDEAVERMKKSYGQSLQQWSEKEGRGVAMFSLSHSQSASLPRGVKDNSIDEEVGSPLFRPEVPQGAESEKHKPEPVNILYEDHQQYSVRIKEESDEQNSLHNTEINTPNICHVKEEVHEVYFDQASPDICKQTDQAEVSEMDIATLPLKAGGSSSQHPSENTSTSEHVKETLQVSFISGDQNNNESVLTLSSEEHSMDDFVLQLGCTEHGRKLNKRENVHKAHYNCRRNGSSGSAESSTTFAHLSGLKVHRRVNSEEKPYICLECGKTFGQHSILQAHQRIHTGEKPYTCLVCKSSFTQLDNLKRHQKIHTVEKSHSCIACGKSLGTLMNIEIHSHVHNEETLNRCTKCESSFSQMDNLIEHQRMHTDQEATGATQPGHL
ncbi:ZN510 protein, partial [Polypterus senegalus]